MVQPEKSKHASHPVHRLRSGEAGVAVLTVLLAIVLLLILSSALFLTARLALERAAQTTDSTRALNVAESGMEAAANAIIEQYKEEWGAWMGRDDTISGSLAGGGDYDVHWDAQTALPWFTMTATGYHPNRDNATGVRRITAQVFSLNPWDFQYAGSMAGKVVGNVRVQGPFYVNDLLELSGFASVLGGPLIIRDTDSDTGSDSRYGDLDISSNGVAIGTNTDNLALFLDGQVTKPKNPQNYNADPIYNWAPELEFRELTQEDLAYYYYSLNDPSPWQETEEAPMAVWDSDSEMGGGIRPLEFSDSSRPEATNMTRVSNRVDWDYSKSGNTTTLTIKFDNSGNDDHAEVRPILFVDGNLTIEASKKFQVRYEGKGTIIATGKISVTGSLVPIGSNMESGLDGIEGFPDTHSLGLITLDNIAYYGHDDDWLAAALYSGGRVSFAFKGNFIGGTVTSILDLSEKQGNGSHLYTQPGFSANLPPRMPGGGASITSIIGWTETTPPSP